MTLQQYLDKHTETAAAFARRIGVSKSVISEFLAGRRGLRDSTKLAIEAATKGKVSAGALVFRK